MKIRNTVGDILRSVDGDESSHDGVSIQPNLEYESLHEMDESAFKEGFEFWTSDDKTKITFSNHSPTASFVGTNTLNIQQKEEHGQQRQKLEEMSLSMETAESDDNSADKTSFATALSKTENVNIETRFIDVGSLVFGGIFGIGEKIEDRVIMARTKVQCLLLPRYWLFEKDQNPGRIWQRRRFVINTSIPSRWQLYKDFLNTRKWQKYKNIFITSVLDRNSVQNPTHSQDIPIMFHIINPVEE